MRVAKNIYNTTGNLLISAGQLLKQSYIDELKSLGFASLFIGETSSDFEVNEVVSEQTRTEATILVHDTISNIKLNRRLDKQRIVGAVQNLVDEILRNRDIIVNIADIKSVGNYNFRHSVNVCVISLVIGKTAGYNQGQLMELGIGTLLHDVGKSLVAEHIMNKPGPLDDGEFKEAMEHARMGYDILKNFNNVSLLARHIAYQHHERIDGSGYPKQRRGDDILEYARIAAIADVYDAITSDRPYRKALPVKDGLSTILEMSPDKLDRRFATLLLRCVAPYPVGVILKLSNGTMGVVARVHKENLDRPLLTLIPRDDMGQIDYKTLGEKPEFLDLSKDENAHIQIEGIA